MCGIVGYVGTKRQAYPILIKGLKRLEYRGYDSAGVALINPDGVLSVDKEKGKVADLERYCADKDTRGTIGIAHTRWATHGEPSARNAHPHYSQSRNLAIIHNGIIENYAEIKARLEEKGVRFRSDTDTEVLVQLIEYIQERKQIELLPAVQLALHQVVGAYAIALLDSRHPDTIIAARKQSPLVVGIGEGEFFLGSDASPIIEFTDKVVYLEDGNIAVMKAGEELQIVNIYNEKLLPEVKTVDIDLGQIEKGGFPHFMLKEIFEQPECLENCMRGRINVDHNHVALSAVIDYRKELLAAKRIIIVACGTSWHAGLIGKQLIESFCRVPVDVEYASEFRYRNPVVGPGDVVIAISQSGETADTLAAVELARERGAFIYGVCNVVGASIPRATHTGSYIHVGPEIGVASTKAFTGQVTVLTLFALALGAVKGTVAREEYVRTIEELANIPDKIREVLKLSDQLAELARTFTYAQLPLPRPWIQLSRRAGGSPEAEGNLLHPCRGLFGSRDEARPHRAHRLRHARRGRGYPRRDVREGAFQRPGDQGTRGTRHRLCLEGRAGHHPDGRRDDRAARHAGVSGAAHGHRSPAVAGLLHRCLQRQGCGPAAQPGQERDGGITKKQ